MMSQPDPANGRTVYPDQPAPGQVWTTPLGERVEIIGYGDTERTLKLRFPDRRPQLNEDGEERPHIQFRDRYAFTDTANREGYALASEDGPTDATSDEDAPEDLPGEWVETPRCPECGAFMSRDMDGMGLPAAQCAACDEGFMDDRELIDGGYFHET